ncbi:MAG: hypothetical protein KA152_09335 [Verrucomicrobiales bacterium]|nr:hypothetical protein [Verrucomicrobiales bacterium]
MDSLPSPSPGATGIKLSEADAAAIGRKIWENECGGTVEGLTSWNAGEDFPSLGIGHFIWYVPGRPGPFQESFPPLIAYMKQKGTPVPVWVTEVNGCPWNSRSEFLKDQGAPRMKELRQFLANTVPVQTGFIVQRLEQALPKMQAATTGEADKARLRENFYKMTGSRTGLYSLIDYVNFKGEGVKPEEKYNGYGWGLRDVLLEMGPSAGGQASANEFSEAAKRVLQRRIKNAPSDRGESRWSAGWMNRCESYKRGI